MNVTTRPAMLDVARIRAGFSDPGADDPRQAAGVPRQRRLGAEAARGDRRHARGDGDAIRQRPSRPALDERAHHRRLRGRARCRRRAAERARPRTRSCSPATAPKRSTWWRTAIGRGDAEAGPGGADLRHGAPLQHRALADAARRRAASSCAWRRSPTPANSTWTAFEALLADGKRRAGVDHAHVERAGHRTRRPSASCRSRTRMARRCCSTARRRWCIARVDVQAIGCDFYAFTGHKLYGPTGIGVLWGAPRVAGGDAAVPRRRRDDLLGDLRAVHLGRGAAQVRGRNAADPGRHRAEGGDRLRAVRSATTRSPRMRRR